jgi:Spy/CpxP family protein refolding chaperone
MDIFAQKKILVRLVVLLAIINIVSIGYFIWKDYERQHREPALFPKIEDYKDVSGILKKELNLTQQQAEQIQNLRNDFFEKEKVLARTIRNEKDSMNQAMFNISTDENLVRTLAQKISANEYQMEMLRFQQAKELKAICTPEQLEKFENLVKEIRDYFRPDNHPKQKENFNSNN